MGNESNVTDRILRKTIFQIRLRLCLGLLVDALLISAAVAFLTMFLAVWTGVSMIWGLLFAAFSAGVSVFRGIGNIGVTRQQVAVYIDDSLGLKGRITASLGVASDSEFCLAVKDDAERMAAGADFRLLNKPLLPTRAAYIPIPLALLFFTYALSSSGTFESRNSNDRLVPLNVDMSDLPDEIRERAVELAAENQPAVSPANNQSNKAERQTSQDSAGDDKESEGGGKGDSDIDKANDASLHNMDGAGRGGGVAKSGGLDKYNVRFQSRTSDHTERLGDASGEIESAPNWTGFREVVENIPPTRRKGVADYMNAITEME